MSLTMEEIKERILMFYDPDDLLEALEISAEQMLDRFEGRLINRLDKFEEEFEIEEENEDEY